MDWHVADGDPDEGRVEWERGDRCARVVARETATRSWAVTLDRLTQAQEGEAYRRETVPDRETALGMAAEWRAANDGSAADAA